MIQIRNVPEDLHRRLKARAAGQEARAVVPKGGQFTETCTWS